MVLLNLLLNLGASNCVILRHLEKFGLSVSSPRDLGENLTLQRDCLPKIQVGRPCRPLIGALHLRGRPRPLSSRLHHRYARPPLWPTSPAEVLAAHPARFGPLARALQFCPNLRFLPCMAEWPRTIAACTLCSLTFVPAFSQYFFGSGCCYSLLFLSLLFLAADPLAAGPRCQSSLPSLPSSLLSSLPSFCPRCHPLVLAAILSSSLPSSRPRCRPRCHPRSSLPVLDAIAAVFAAIRAARLLVR